MYEISSLRQVKIKVLTSVPLEMGGDWKTTPGTACKHRFLGIKVFAMAYGLTVLRRLYTYPGNKCSCGQQMSGAKFSHRWGGGFQTKKGRKIE